MAADGAGRLSRVGVRTRTTAAAVAVVAIVLIASGAVFMVALRDALDDHARDAARVRAASIAAAERDGVFPRADEVVVQVVDRDGEVIDQSPGLVADGPLANLRPGESRRVDDVSVRDDGRTEDEPYLLVARRLPGGDVLLVGESLEAADDSIAAAARLLAIGIPAVVAWVIWWVVGRALAPVERARAEVAAISGPDLHRRVAEAPCDDEIGRLTRTLNAMLDRLESSQARERQFVSDSSHELRSPVSAIRHHAEVARLHPEATTVGGLADDVLAEEVRLEQLVDDLLWVARLDESTDREHRSVDLDDLVLDEVRRARSTTDRVLDVSSVSAGRVRGDAGQLRRLVRNLLDNATRHARAHVVLSLREDAERVVLRVDDDGPGIPAVDRARVLDRFVRLDDARARDDGGSGLGLAIVTAIVAAHGGEVTIGEAPAGGARVEVVLPRDR